MQDHTSNLAQSSTTFDQSMEITLRPYQLPDVDVFMEWACDDKVIRSSRLRHYSSKDDALNYLKEDAIPHPWYRAICLDGRPTGYISVMPGSSIEKCRGTISYALGSKYWGRGITTVAVKRAASTEFEEFPDVKRIEGIVHVNNKASQKVLEKARFLKEGVLRKYLCLDEETIDFAMYSLLSADPILHWNCIFLLHC